METLTNKLNLVKALLAFQSEVDIIHKGTQGHNYTYSDLAEIMRAIQPLLTKNKLGITQDISVKNTIVSVTTTIFHTSGEFMESVVSGDISQNSGRMQNIQVVGSLTTYLRRYAISSMLNLVTDKDTDGDTGGDNKNENKNKNDNNGNKNQNTPKPPVDEWVMINGVHRWNKTKKCFNEAYQKKNDLINTLEWKKIQELVNKKLNSDMAIFKKWLETNYKVKSYDITNKMLPGIITSIDCNPNTIIDSVADEK